MRPCRSAASLAPMIILCGVKIASLGSYMGAGYPNQSFVARIVVSGLVSITPFPGTRE
jgi:hypothetical protein